ncbi:MAG TPA: L,D-transpeptidase family protein, partial [Bdellovibrionota bacterium]|nr:L,D-transpeptidase family protein [Bdellovibrionota bacterium]
MRRPGARAVVSLLLAFVLTGCAHGLFGSSLKSKVSNRLEQRFAASAFPEGVILKDELARQYRAIVYTPVWMASGGIGEQAQELLRALETAPGEGFRIEDYHVAEMQKLLAEARSLTPEQVESDGAIDRFATLEMMLSDAFILYERDLFKGRVDPRVGDPEWFVKDGKLDLISQSLISLEREGSPTPILREVTLESRAYIKLKEMLARYQAIAQAGGWPVIHGWSARHRRPKVRPGERDDVRVPMLRKRLAITGDFVVAEPPALASSGRVPAEIVGPPSNDDGLMDSQLVKGLQNFQIRHGLEPDGVLGGETLSELNVPVDRRLHQIEANLERLRWLPRPLGSRYIMVNITDFSLQVFEKDQQRVTMKVVVGQEARRTPSFSSPLRKMVINPNWFVPHKLASKDLLPLFKRDPESLVRKGFRVFQRKRGGMQLLDPLKIDWAKVTEEKFPYEVIQSPGPYNSLGEIKFMPPNPFAIYLHGTPRKELFKKRVRAASSGCIRIEDPIDLAEYVMKGDDDWNRDALIKEILHGTNQSVKLPKKIPLYL